METRKLVKTGANTYTLSLPKDWVNNNNLKKGDILYVTEDDNSLIITPMLKKENSVKEVTITIDDKEINTIRRETIAAYINNHQLFIFTGKSLSNKLKEIHQILNNFLALEVQEQTDTRLVAKDFLNLEEFSLKNTLRRIDMLTRSLLTDAANDASSLELRDFEIDKHYFLISRLIRNKLFKKTGNLETHNAWFFAKTVEKIADAAKEVSGLLDNKSKEFYKELENYYRDASTAYFKADKKSADSLIAKRKELIEKNDKIQPATRIFFRDIIDGSRNIAKITLDNSE